MNEEKWYGHGNKQAKTWFVAGELNCKKVHSGKHSIPREKHADTKHEKCELAFFLVDSSFRLITFSC